MTLLLINEKFAGQLVNAVGNTLVHSLWQGVLLAVTAGLIVLCTRRLSAALRYNLLLSALLLFAAGVVVTFATQFAGAQTMVQGVQLTQATSQTAIVINTYQTVATAPASGFFNVLPGYLNSHYTTIVLVWFLIICAKCIQLTVGLHGTYRLKYTSVLPVAYHWQARLQQLAAMLRIKQGITLLESGLAKVPLVIGHLKPVILLPAGLLTSLTTAEIEAILLHELAHIRRRDYLVNLLQSLMEIVLFFNPAVLWVSQLLKTERENCCDDLALQQSNNKATYIRALVSCEERRLPQPVQAMAFPGQKHGLLNRIKRVAGNGNNTLNLFEKTALAVCLVASGICIFAFNKKQPVKQPVHHAVDAAPDTTPAKANEPVVTNLHTVPEQTDSVFYPPSYNPGPEGTPGYDAWKREDDAANEHIIADMLKDGIITDGRNLSFKLSGKKFVVNGRRLGDDIFKRYAQKYVPPARLETEWTWSHTVTDSPTANPVTPSYAQQGVYADSVAARAKQSITRAAELMQVHAPSPKTYEAQPKAYNPPPKQYNDSAAAYDSVARGYGYNQPRDRDPSIQALRDKTILAEILTDMLHDDIIVEKDNIYFTLTGDAFIVNGKKQANAIFQWYKKKYVPVNDRNNWTWSHSQHLPRRT